MPKKAQHFGKTALLGKKHFGIIALFGEKNFGIIANIAIFAAENQIYNAL